VGCTKTNIRARRQKLALQKLPSQKFLSHLPGRGDARKISAIVSKRYRCTPPPCTVWLFGTGSTPPRFPRSFSCGYGTYSTPIRYDVIRFQIRCNAMKPCQNAIIFIVRNLALKTNLSVHSRTYTMLACFRLFASQTSRNILVYFFEKDFCL